MTTNPLLLPDEAARLVPGERFVIVRAGGKCGCGGAGYFADTQDGGYMVECMCGGYGSLAPQAWVALTGPCPTCDGDVLMAGKFGVDPLGLKRCPACRDGRRIVPLYMPIGRNLADNATPGYEVEMNLLVGTGSIEVVPVVSEDQARENWTQPRIEVTDQGLTIMFSSDYGTYRLALDPLPVPGRDFGIVIDCVEVV